MLNHSNPRCFSHFPLETNSPFPNLSSNIICQGEFPVKSMHKRSSFRYSHISHCLHPLMGWVWVSLFLFYFILKVFLFEKKRERHTHTLDRVLPCHSPPNSLTVSRLHRQPQVFRSTRIRTQAHPVWLQGCPAARYCLCHVDWTCLSLSSHLSPLLITASLLRIEYPV